MRKRFTPIAINTIVLLLLIIGVINLFSNLMLPELSPQAEKLFHEYNSSYYLGYILFSVQILIALSLLSKNFVLLCFVFSFILSLIFIAFHLLYDFHAFIDVKNILAAIILFISSLYLLIVFRGKFKTHLLKQKLDD
jgi:hypothetical protein